MRFLWDIWAQGGRTQKEEGAAVFFGRPSFKRKRIDEFADLHKVLSAISAQVSAIAGSGNVEGIALSSLETSTAEVEDRVSAMLA